MLLGMGMASAQVNYTQTTTNDFLKGTGQNVNIANDAVALQQKFASAGDWAATTNMPQNLKGHQMVLWRNYVYIVGGYNGSGCVNTVYRATQLDNGVSGWSGLTGLPVALKDMGVAVTQTHLVVIGGRTNDTVSDKIYSAPFNDDGSIGAWQELSVSLPQPTWGLRAVDALGSIYVIGGANTDSENDATDKVYHLKVNATGEVTGIVEMNSLPEPRNGHAVTVYNSKIIVTGGYDASHTAQNTVYSATVNLNGTLATWATKAPLTEAVYDHTTVSANGILTVIGGNNGSLPSNKFYYADADASTYSWTLSDVMLPERYYRCASFAFGNKIFLCGGEATSGTLNNLVNYMPVTTSDEPVKKSAFIGIPFYIGTPKTMQELSYTLTNPTSKTYEILYRTASENKNYGNWTSKSTDLPATVNESKSYIQYMFRVTATGENDFSIDDVTLTLSGYNQLDGNLNDIDTLKLANSPYIATSDISFTSGTHVIEGGVTIMFMPNTGLSIGQASVNFNGTEAAPILLTAYEAGAGSWNGVYFQDASDNGVASVMNYTTIEKAGNGGNAANLRLYYTNQPTMDHCTIQYSIKDGAFFQNSSPTLTDCTFAESPENWSGLALINSSPVLTSCTISNNSFQGLHLNNSAPTCTNCTMTGNMYGVYYQTTNFNAVFTGVTISNNQYGMYSCSPNRSFTFDDSSITFVDNTGADIAVAGGQMGNDQTWNNYPNGYALLGNVEVYGGTPKLTVQAGTTIKGLPGYGLYVGRNGNQGGMLYAVGTEEAPITFTALNGEVGGWDGVRFRDGSDYSSNSSMRHCVVEKATTNLVCESTNQPGVMWCMFKDARDQNVYLNSANISMEESTMKDAPRGLWVNSSSPTLVSVVFENHSEACVYHNNGCTVTYSDCTMKDSFIGVRYETPDRDMVNNPNITFDNLVANIGVPAGHFQSDRTWEPNTYAMLGDIRVGRRYNWSPNYNRLTLMPGTTLMFAEGKRMEVSGGWDYSWYGELYAEGTAEQPITFTSLNGESGGWYGLVFNSQNDDISEISSSLKHCIIEKGNEFNMVIGDSYQPALIEDCVFRNSVGHGVLMYSCYDTLRNCSFENNGGYALYYQNGAHYVGVLENLTFIGNQYDGIGVNGGHIQENRVWNAYTYYILNGIRVGRRYNWSPNYNRLTLMPGTTLKFAEGKGMEVSGGWDYSWYGELYAEGTTDQPITFTSINGESGGWYGLVFNSQNDDIAEISSSMKHCVVEKGNEFNMVIGDSYQPALIEDCVFRKSVGHGVLMYSCYDTLRNCAFENNAGYALYYQNGAHYVGVLENLTFTGNQYDGIGVNGGHIQEDRTWNAYTYFMLNDIRVGRYRNWDPNHNRWTLKPGTTLKFAEGKRMDIGGYWSGSYYGEFYAEGTAAQPITFTSMNGENGGWNGIVFNGESDDFENASSSLKYCIIEKGNERNLHLGSTYQPALIEDCIFRKSVQHCVYMGDSRDTLRNCVFEDNEGYSLYYNNAHYVGVLENLSFTNNQYDGVTIEGGHITEDRTWNAYTYFILNDMNVGRYINWDPNHCRLNLMPGTTIKVNAGKRISIAVDNYCGELYAIGTPEEPILFTSINGEVGGWNGIVFPGRSDDFSDPSSLLKYCIFEKGNEYNLIATGTTLPEIENCVFQNSNLYGLRIDNEYCQTIKNSVIRNNASHGIYITNTTPFTLGGSPEYACSLYGNGGYAVYQDGGSNIDMSYNFWGNIGENYIDDYLIYDKLDNSSKGRITFEPVCWFPTENFGHLIGTFAYNDNKLLGNLDLEILDVNDSIVASTTTNASGQYDFADYNVSVYNTLNTDFGVDILAGVNATDALLTMRHFVHLDTLTDAQFAAADVNNNGVVNGTDAMLILRRTVNEAFPAGDFYYFNPNGMTISGDTCHYDLSFLCYGDVNGSYTPQNRNNIALLMEGEMLTDSYQEMMIPVSVKNPATTGAITLHLGYPAEYLEIQDVTLAATGESLLFLANDGELRTAWYSLDALTLNENDLLINIKVRTNDLSLLVEPIAFTMEAYSELADGNAQPIDGVVIAMPVLTTPTMGVSDNMMGEGVSLSVYPNPANDQCHVKVELPEAGRVKVELYNMLGIKVMDVENTHYEAGSHELLIVTSPLAAGVYQCRVIFEGVRSWVKSNVIIIEK